jgi:uncharacterized protein YqeY
MSILEKLERDMIEATKARESERLGVIRFVRSEVKNRQIELGRALEDDDVIEVLARVAKRHNESIEQFAVGGRDDLVDRERRQLAVVESYLPEKLGDDEIAELITQAIEETGATGRGGLGLVMKTIMPKLRGRADGSAVKQMVEKRLSEPAEE